jgi:hypothetical protein
MTARILTPTSLFVGASFFDFGVRVNDLDGAPIDITGYDFDYTWTRVGDSSPVLSLDQSDSEVTVGAGTGLNQVTIELTGTQTTLAPGTYCVAYTVDDTAGNVWKSKRLITLVRHC